MLLLLLFAFAIGIVYWIWKKHQRKASLCALVQFLDCAPIILEYSGELKRWSQDLVAINDPKLIMFAIANKLIPPSDMFIAACSSGNLRMLHWLLESRLCTLQHARQKNMCALRKACKHNHYKVVAFLLRTVTFSAKELRCGGNIRCTDDTKKTVNCYLLKYACINNYYQIVKQLLQTNVFKVADIARGGGSYWQNRDNYNVRKTCDLLYDFCVANDHRGSQDDQVLTCLLRALFLSHKTPYRVLENNIRGCVDAIDQFCF